MFQEDFPTKWKCIKVIYSILPFADGTQAYFACHLECPHYQVVQSEITRWIKAMQESAVEVEILYSKLGVQEFQETSFLRATNVAHDDPMFQDIDWDKAAAASRNDLESTVDTHRGNAYVEAGFASDTNRSRTDQELCISVPLFLDCTTEPHFQQLFSTVSKILPHLAPDDIKDSVYVSDKTCAKEFAS